MLTEPNSATTLPSEIKWTISSSTTEGIPDGKPIKLAESDVAQKNILKRKKKRKDEENGCSRRLHQLYQFITHGKILTTLQ